MSLNRSAARWLAKSSPLIGLLAIACIVTVPTNALAVTAGEITETSAWTQAKDFLSLSNPAVKIAVAGSVLLGICCGLIGSFVVVRRLALAGDAISHAILPGIA